MNNGTDTILLQIVVKGIAFTFSDQDWKQVICILLIREQIRQSH